MSWDSTPWFVGGGAQHSPEIARLLAHAAVGGAEGVVGYSDLKVTATPTPGSQVRVAPGAGLVRNRYSGAPSQTYVVRNTASHNRAIAATGSGGMRRDLVVARVGDPQYAGQPPANPAQHAYVDTHVITGVPAGTTSAAQLNLGYPAIALARIDIPASTATITNAMIVDLRKVANPKRERRMHVMAPVVSHNMPAGSFARWPNVAALNVEVPEWATRVDVLWHLGGLRPMGTTQNDHEADIMARFGGQNGEQIKVGFEAGNMGRQNFVCASLFTVPEAQRGTVQLIEHTGLRGAVGGGYFQSDYKSICVLDWEFTEFAV